MMTCCIPGASSEDGSTLKWASVSKIRQSCRGEPLNGLGPARTPWARLRRETSFT